jgi:NAD(P)-dependent dehydrogenase (short-subunit alcohol dehydrogenase family)
MGKVQYDFSGNRAVVTGATKGIGREIAMALAHAGCDVGITGRNQNELDELKQEIVKTGQRCESYRADLSSDKSCIEMTDYFSGLLDPIDILINNAGLSFPEKVVDLKVDHWNTTINVNLRAPVLIAREIGKKMVERKAGVVVNMSSNASLAGIEDHLAYCASKFGLNGATKVMALEWGAAGVRVNAVAPTVTLTPLAQQVWGDPAKADPVKAAIPLGRFAETKDVVDAVLFLCSDSASMISGEVLVIDGGANAVLY